MITVLDQKQGKLCDNLIYSINLLVSRDRPLLKVIDNLLVMGMLTDDDLHQLLYLIDPETFDDSYSRGKHTTTTCPTCWPTAHQTSAFI